MNTPGKRALLIFGYMAFIFCVVLALIHYAARHPLEDPRPRQEKSGHGYGNGGAVITGDIR